MTIEKKVSSLSSVDIVNRIEDSDWEGICDECGGDSEAEDGCDVMSALCDELALRVEAAMYAMPDCASLTDEIIADYRRERVTGTGRWARIALDLINFEK